MNNKKAAFQAALPLTIPVFAGYIMLGATFGILMDSNGLSILWILLSSVFIYAGSMQFVSVTLLAGGFDPIGAFLVTLMVNARHIVYGVSMLGQFRGLGKLKPYLIFSLTDETFSILCSTEPPEGVDRNWFLFFISFLDHIYWIAGSLLGGIIGSMIQFNTKGSEFVLTSLFVVIFINQMKAASTHLPAVIGIFSAVVCRILFGTSYIFIIPAMLLIIFFVTVFKKPIERRDKK